MLFFIIQDFQIALEGQFGARGREQFVSTCDSDRLGLIDRRLHPAGHKTLPDQLVQTVLVSLEIIFHQFRREVHVGRADGFMRVLRRVFVLHGPVAHKTISIMFADISLAGTVGFVGDAGGVGTKVGDQTDRAVACDAYAFIQLLRKRHGLPGREVQEVRGILLKRGSRERVGRVFASGAFTDFTDNEFLAGKTLLKLLHGLFGVQFHPDVLVLADLAVIIRAETVFSGQKLRFETPVFLRDESLDLGFAVADHPKHGGLHAAGGQFAFDFLPEDRRQFVADDAVHDTPRLLRVHQVHVDFRRLLQRALHRGLGDLVKLDAAGILAFHVQRFFQMPCNGLSFAVRVGRKINAVGLLDGLLQRRQKVALSADRDVLWLESVLRIHAERALRQVTDVSLTGHDLIAGTEKFLNGVYFCRRLHDDELIRHPVSPPFLFRLL